MNAPQLPSSLASVGTITQIAFIPADWEKAIEFWTKIIGAGPFFELPHIGLSNTRYRGQPTEVDISALLGYWGNIQIELIRQHDDTPSIYNEWRPDQGERVQHLGILVPDFDQAFDDLKSKGGVAAFETEITGATRAAYFEMAGIEPMVEILSLKPHFLNLWEKMKQTTREWDGFTDPVRPVPKESEWM